MSVWSDRDAVYRVIAVHGVSLKGNTQVAAAELQCLSVCFSYLQVSKESIGVRPFWTNSLSNNVALLWCAHTHQGYVIGFLSYSEASEKMG